MQTISELRREAKIAHALQQLRDAAVRLGEAGFDLTTIGVTSDLVERIDACPASELPTRARTGSPQLV